MISQQSGRNGSAGTRATAPSHAQARVLFDRTADHYQRRSELKVASFSSLIFQRRIDLVTREIDRIAAPGVVLDYGMGPAVFGRACTGRGLRYVGIDISPEMVRRARALGLPNAEFAVGDLEALGAYAGRMDAVLAIGLLDYLEEPFTAIEMLTACLRPGGRIVLSFRNKHSVPRVLRDTAKRCLAPLRAEFNRRAFLSQVNEHSFDAEADLAVALRRAGCGIVNAAYFNCSPFFFDFPLPVWLWQTWNRCDASLASPETRYLCSGGVLTAQKG